MNNTIKAAIAAGEAEAAKKKAAADAVEAKKEAENQARRQRYYANAVKWAETILPGKITEATANGHRSLGVDEYEAWACGKLGMTVKSYVNHRCGAEEMCDDSCRNVYSVEW